ncbi:short-chain dehydrogenase [Pseudidiomarina tainanensis]|uniref:Short-chain dehydrogenase n=1 Tax=Pseudidiomarina tainanensis TaxID=502365 RepID=A0ACD2HK05_9GAMM|nr:SDR family oxidoreductase [Pseudidiomarina tainanensis]RZQ56504.1 short-chain dehydrogenase [Pseudidiomarina tainanensis]
MTQHIVITGANRGIGLALATQFKQRGDNVTAVCRKASEELKALGVSIIENIDVTHADSISELSQQLSGHSIDILINNAGLLEREHLGSLSTATIEAQFKVNAMGPLLVTDALRDNLHKGSKVIMITSRMGSMADNGSGAYYGYRMSKAALNAAGVSLANDLKDDGIAVAMLHPGFVQTEMVNNAGDISADTAAERLIQRIDELTIDTTGQFKHSNGDSLPW